MGYTGSPNLSQTFGSHPEFFGLPKDSKGRDPAVSYGDVQLQRHLERLQRLVLARGSKAEC